MRAWRPQFVRLLAALLLCGCLPLSAAAQRGKRGGRAAPPAPPPHGNPAPAPGRAEPERERAGKEIGAGRAMASVPPHLMERLRDMTPEAQERFMTNNSRFRGLPPERQEKVRKQLQYWNSLTPQQREAIRDRWRVWSKMTPEQQRHIRQELLPSWQNLSLDRRQSLLGKLHALRDLNDSQRAAKLNDPAFLSDLSPAERNMLRELSNLRVGTAPEPPGENP